MLKRILKTLALSLLLLGMALPARAVSQKEMEQARTITAFWYLRYANDGAGYMEDGKMPSTMTELEKMLKETERANLKAFKAVSTPSDYATWDKKKLVAYWGGTFFNSPGLSAKGKVARRRVEGKLNAMTVASPTAEAAAPAEQPAAAQAQDVAAKAPAAPQPAVAADAPVRETARAVDSSVAVVEEPEVRQDRRGGSGSTWIYIVALIVLVGVVIWLVIFASKTMQQSESRHDDASDDEGRVRRRQPAEASSAALHAEASARSSDREVRAQHRE
ncbi:MAG: hypothetical protein K2H21_01065, partial [Muribaculaceae bacterium]|nr:hypothetical protein [Muribaculaceae bacterium]